MGLILLLTLAWQINNSACRLMDCLTALLLLCAKRLVVCVLPHVFFGYRKLVVRIFCSPSLFPLQLSAPLSTAVYELLPR